MQPTALSRGGGLGASFRPRRSRKAGGSSRSGGSRRDRAAGFQSATPPTVARGSSGPGWLNCSIAARSYPIRRNTVLLSACLLLLSGVLQLAVAVATITLVLVTGIESILGLGPAIFITAGALAALPGRAAHGPDRARARDLGRVRGRRGRLRAHGRRVRRGQLRRRDRRVRRCRRDERRRAARADGRGGHVPAGASRPGHLVRPVRRALRGGTRAARLPPALRGQGPGARHARRPLARGRGDRARRACSLPSRSARIRGRSRSSSERRRRRAGCARGPAARDPRASRGSLRGHRGARELRGHGLRDEPERLHRRRPPPRAGRRLHRHQPPHRRDVRARARHRRAHRPDRAGGPA